MKVFALCLLVPAFVAAQQAPRGAAPPQRSAPPQQAPAKTEDLCALEGMVMNASTGEPLGKAALTLRRVDAPPGPPGYGGPSYSYSATSQASGGFAIAGIEPGKYRLSATRTGFVAVDYGARDYLQPGSTITLEARQRMSGVMLRMTPNGVITGHVVDEDREPVAFLQVQAMRYRYTQGKKQLVSYGGATTNDLGEYRIFGLPPGRYFISVSARRGYGQDRRPAAQTGQEEEYVATYYPGTTEVASASPLEIGPGALFTGADIALGKRRTVHVKGHITDNTGLERRRPMVMLVPRGPGGVSATRSSGVDANGNFDLRGITAGSYTLLATIPDRGRSFSAKMPVEVGSGSVENLSLTLTPGMTLSGAVRLD
jgi:carboxypeptidase family protein